MIRLRKMGLLRNLYSCSFTFLPYENSSEVVNNRDVDLEVERRQLSGR